MNWWRSERTQSIQHVNDYKAEYYQLHFRLADSEGYEGGVLSISCIYMYRLPPNVASRASGKASFQLLPQLQRLDRKVKFHLSKYMYTYGTFQKANNTGAYQTARMHRLVCACVVHKHLKTGFLSYRLPPKEPRHEISNNVAF